MKHQTYSGAGQAYMHGIRVAHSAKEGFGQGHDLNDTFDLGPNLDRLFAHRHSPLTLSHPAQLSRQESGHLRLSIRASRVDGAISRDLVRIGQQ